MFIETTGGFIAATEITELRETTHGEYTAKLRDGSTRDIDAEAAGLLARAGQLLPARPDDAALVCVTWDEEDGSIGHTTYQVPIVGWRVRGRNFAEFAEPITTDETHGNARVRMGIVLRDGRIHEQHVDMYKDRHAFVAAAVAEHEAVRRALAGKSPASPGEPSTAVQPA
jgi:hypothetical protein